MLAVFRSLIVLVVVLYTTAAPTWYPSVLKPRKILVMIAKH